MRDNETVIKEAFERPEWYLRSAAYNIRIRCETIHEFLHGRRYQNILDIGCGDGSLSFPLLTQNSKVTLLDRSRDMLGRAVSRVSGELVENTTVVNADFMTAELPTAPYDLVMCVGVLAYVNDPCAFLQKVAAVLSPGGTLILECTDGDHVMSHYFRAYDAVRRIWMGDELFRTAKRSSMSVLRIASECGFAVRNSFRYSLPPSGMRKFVPQKVSYSAIRNVFGCAGRNRVPWLGNECIYCFELCGVGERSGETVVSS
ncbi:class I SAM-dependent methyltransferase [Verrucomicrobiota bacterium sgz303538]